MDLTTMTTFAQWLADMQSAGLIPTSRSEKPKAVAAGLLGVTDDTITNLLTERVPFDLRTRLACRALLHRMPPYGS